MPPGRVTASGWMDGCRRLESAAEEKRRAGLGGCFSGPLRHAVRGSCGRGFADLRACGEPRHPVTPAGSAETATASGPDSAAAASASRPGGASAASGPRDAAPNTRPGTSAAPRPPAAAANPDPCDDASAASGPCDAAPDPRPCETPSGPRPSAGSRGAAESPVTAEGPFAPRPGPGGHHDPRRLSADGQEGQPDHPDIGAAHRHRGQPGPNLLVAVGLGIEQQVWDSAGAEPLSRTAAGRPG
jgi:hypothetical protein